MSIDDLKTRLRDIPGIEHLTMQNLLGRQIFGWNGLMAGVDPSATDQDIEDAIRNTAAKADRPDELIASTIKQMLTPSSATLPTVNLTEPKAMTTPAPGSFAASIRAMMDEARAGVAQARTDGLAKVGEAVGKLNDAKVATTKVASTMAQTIEDEAASVLSELGQISNDL
jgi:hypothetical protein